jgi:hypothetical protein
VSASVRLKIQGQSARRVTSRVRQCHLLIKNLGDFSEAYTCKQLGPSRATCNKHEHTPDADMSMFLTAPFCKKVESPHEAPRGAKLKKDFDQEMHAGLRAGYMY